jgi:hypothetical protein
MRQAGPHAGASSAFADPCLRTSQAIGPSADRGVRSRPDRLASIRGLGRSLGQPLSDEKVERLLADFRSALVKPEWHLVDVSNTDAVARGRAEPRRCALVAEGDDVRLYYDPVEREFTLAMGDPPATIGVGGDAVGCWMSR